MPRSRYQCHGIKRDGTRCELTTSGDKKFCNHHPLSDGMVTKTGFADLEGFDPSRVSQLLRSGTIEETEDGWIEWAAAREAVAASRDPTKALQREAEQYAAEEGDISGDEIKKRYDIARMKREEEDARLKEIDRLEAEGRLICADTMKRHISECCLTTRAQLMTIPGRIAADVLRLTDQREVHDLIEGEIRDCLSELMTSLGAEE